MKVGLPTPESRLSNGRCKYFFYPKYNCILREHEHVLLKIVFEVFNREFNKKDRNHACLIPYEYNKNIYCYKGKVYIFLVLYYL